MIDEGSGNIADSGFGPRLLRHKPTLQRASHDGCNSVVKSSSRSAIGLATGRLFMLETRFLIRGRQSCQPMTLGPAFVGVTRIMQRRCLVMAER